MNIITRLEIFLGLISFVTSKTETFITECIHFIEQKYKDKRISYKEMQQTPHYVRPILWTTRKTNF